MNEPTHVPSHAVAGGDPAPSHLIPLMLPPVSNVHSVLFVSGHLICELVQRRFILSGTVLLKVAGSDRDRTADLSDC